MIRFNLAIGSLAFVLAASAPSFAHNPTTKAMHSCKGMSHAMMMKHRSCAAWMKMHYKGMKHNAMMKHDMMKHDGMNMGDDKMAPAH